MAVGRPWQLLQFFYLFFTNSYRGGGGGGAVANQDSVAIGVIRTNCQTLQPPQKCQTLLPPQKCSLSRAGVVIRSPIIFYTHILDLFKQFMLQYKHTSIRILQSAGSVGDCVSHTRTIKTHISSTELQSCMAYE